MRRRPSIVPALLVGGAILVGGVAVARASGRRTEAEDWLSPDRTEDIEESDEVSETGGLGVLPERLKDLTPADSSQLTKVAGIYFERVTAERLEELIKSARADGLKAPLLTPLSGYRSPGSQQRLWQRALTKYRAKLRNSGKEPTDEEVERETRRWVAKPGNSTHQTGRAVDFELGTPIRSEAAPAARATQAFLWLKGNAGRFGFSNYEPEPWHWERTR